MMHKKMLMASVVAGLALVVGWASMTLTASADGPGDAAAVVEGNSQFACDLYARLRGAEAHQGKNLFFAPNSLSTALAMTYAGARGRTATQMEEVLHFSLGQEKLHPAFKGLLAKLKSSEGKGCEISSANALWGQKGYAFLNEFLKLVEANYGAGLQQVDFAGDTEGARKTINAWVEKETRDKIKDLIGPWILKPPTFLVLTNAIYFKGDWASPFRVGDTRNRPFTLSDGQKINVPMMHQTEWFRYVETDGLQAVELPYKGRGISMVVLLPREHDGLDALESSFTEENLRMWLGRLKLRRVALSMPKFKATSEFCLGETLRSMGMTDAFSPPRADFCGMDGTGALFITAVVHKAFVDVDERGTEAVAATAVAMASEGLPPVPVVFKADHPFAFVIRHVKTGSILFMGRVMNPSAGSGEGECGKPPGMD